MRKVFAVMAVLALLGVSGVAMAIDINGGTSWGGWTYKGASNDLGIYGNGVTANPYSIYTTVFTYSGNPVTGSPVGGGGVPDGFGSGFNNGDLILGVGIHMIGNESLIGYRYTLKFDIGNDSYRAATSVGGTDGRANGIPWANSGDFNVQNFGSAPDTMNVYNGVGGYTSIYAGEDNGPTRPFASFCATDSYQLFVNLSQVSAWQFMSNSSAPPIPAFGSSLTLALNGGYNNNIAVFGTPLPEPSSLIALVGGLGSLLVLRRRRA